MNGCGDLQGYLLEALDDAGRADFEAHAAGCATCGAALRTWRRGDIAMGEWRRATQSAVPTEDRAASLMRAARRTADGEARGRSGIRFTLVAVSIAAVTAVGAYLVLARPEATHPTADTPIAARDDGAPVEILFNDNGSLTGGGEDGQRMLSVPGPGRLLVALRGDRYGFGAGSGAAIIESTKDTVSLRLDQGRVAVAARKRAAGETLVVRAGAWAVTVVGTRFEVAFESGGVTVAVDEGEVAMQSAGGPGRFVGAGVRLVAGPGDRMREEALSAEDRAAIAAALNDEPAPPATPPPRLEADVEPERSTPSNAPSERSIRKTTDAVLPAPDLETVRRWILDGEHDRAKAALENRVQGAPDEAEAWMLLATCRQKTGDRSGAMAAYEEVIAHGDAAGSNRGRFLAAKLYQEGLEAPDRAELMLEEYLSHAPKPLEAEAMVRLAQVELALGKEAEARKTAADVARRFPGSAQALAAQGLFENAAP